MKYIFTTMHYNKYLHMIKHYKAISYMSYTLVRQWCHYNLYLLQNKYLKLYSNIPKYEYFLKSRIFVGPYNMEDITIIDMTTLHVTIIFLRTYVVLYHNMQSLILLPY